RCFLFPVLHPPILPVPGSSGRLPESGVLVPLFLLHDMELSEASPLNSLLIISNYFHTPSIRRKTVKSFIISMKKPTPKRHRFSIYPSYNCLNPPVLYRILTSESLLCYLSFAIIVSTI